MIVRTVIYGYLLIKLEVNDKVDNVPCTSKTLRMLSARPTHPTMRISFGSFTCSIVINLSKDCRKIERARARRNTPLKKEPAPHIKPRF